MRFIALLFVFLCFYSQASALPLEEFGSLPVAHAGRIKPLSVFAREQLREIHGETTWQKRPATDWLARILFDPRSMDDERAILLKSSILRDNLKLKHHSKNLYTLEELRRAMQPHLPQILAAVLAVQREQPVTPLQEQLVEIYQRIRQFQQLQDSLNMVLPLPSETATTYDALRRKGERNPLMEQMEERGSQNQIFAVLPSSWQGDEDWYAPWELYFNGKGSPQSAQLMRHWGDLAKAYRNEDAALWDKSLSALHEAARPHKNPLKLWLEEWYYTLSLISLAVAGYGGCALFYAFLGFNPKTQNQKSGCSGQARARQLFLFCIAIAPLLLHGLALLVRMLILGRPPVSNLYESVLFVSFVMSVSAFVLAWRQDKTWLIPAASAASALLLILSQSLLAGQERLPVVMAVLNTNFWLGTHVICITAGYAAAILLSITAHYSLWTAQPARHLNLLALLALLLTAVGTLLGGIWADQSWGRFWGWDPKENGALLIVLWITWLLHGRLAGQIGERWYLAGLSYLSVIVALAWFGVNLLSVGLHSYGFTQGTAWGLVGFIALETLIVLFLTLRPGLSHRFPS